MEHENKQPTIPSVINFNYIKSSCFRVVHCDGVIGAPTPQANITASIFSERVPIPQQVALKVDSTGHLGAEIKERRIQREGIVREVEVELVMSVEVAKQFSDWLLANIKAVNEGRERADAAKGGANK